MCRKYSKYLAFVQELIDPLVYFVTECGFRIRKARSGRSFSFCLNNHPRQRRQQIKRFLSGNNHSLLKFFASSRVF